LALTGLAMIIGAGCESKKRSERGRINDLKQKLVNQKDMSNLYFMKAGSEEVLMNFVRDDRGTYGEARFVDFWVRTPSEIDSVLKDSTHNAIANLANFWKPSNVTDAVHVGADRRIGFTLYFANIDSVYAFSQYYINEVLSVDTSEKLIFIEEKLD